MSGAARRQEALLRLRRRLTLLAAGLTGAVLLVMALVALSIAEEQLRVSRESAFQSNINAIVAKIQADRIISTEWLAQTEATDRLIIALWDGGAPLRFSGAWTPETRPGDADPAGTRGGRGQRRGRGRPAPLGH